MAVAPLVTIVVPVHDTGRFIEPSIRSIVAQSMPAARIEALFVDDGSTDDTPNRLARAAAAHANVRVLTIPPSGAPGRPRNLGLATARGKYVLFLDADDELAPRALENLTRVAERNGSDVVLGKHASETLTRRQDIFQRNRPRCTLRDTPGLIRASFAANKLFRTEFLRQYGITFPEGWRQMEDQLFTLRAYLRAGVISVFADEPCYFFHRRDDEQHISAELPEPVQHVEHLGEILKTVASEQDLGPLRNRLITKFYRAEALSRLVAPAFLEAGTEYQVALFRSVRRLADQWFNDEIQRGLGPLLQLASTLVREDRLDALLTLSSRLAELHVGAHTTRAAWVDGAIRLSFTIALNRTDGLPLVVVADGPRRILDPALTAGLQVDPIDVTADLENVRGQISVLHPESALEWLLPVRSRVELTPADSADQRGQATFVPVVIGETVLDPEAVGPGRRALEDAVWSITARWSGLGLTRTGPLGATGRGAGSDVLPPRILRQSSRWAIPRGDETGAISLGIEPIGAAIPQLDLDGVRLLPGASSLRILLPVGTGREGALGKLDLDAVALGGGSSGARPLRGILRGRSGRVVLDLVAATDLPPGRYRVSMPVIGASERRDLASIAVTNEGARVEDLAKLSRLSWVALQATWLGRATKLAVRRGVAAGRERVPRRARTALRRAATLVQR